MLSVVPISHTVTISFTVSNLPGMVVIIFLLILQIRVNLLLQETSKMRIILGIFFLSEDEQSKDCFRNI